MKRISIDLLLGASRFPYMIQLIHSIIELYIQCAHVTPSRKPRIIINLHSSTTLSTLSDISSLFVFPISKREPIFISFPAPL